MMRIDVGRLLLTIGLLAPLVLAGQSLLFVLPLPMEPKELQGHWVGTGPGGDCSVTIKGDVLRYQQPPLNDGEESMWFETKFTVPEKANVQQLHATIVKNSYPDQQHVGKVIVVLFGMMDETLMMGVVDSVDEPLAEPSKATWDDVIDEYSLKKKDPAKCQTAGKTQKKTQ